MKVIGIAGNATCGKDTYFALAKKIIEEHYDGKVEVRRIAFADFLKSMCFDFCLEVFNINVLNPTKEQKELIRPFLVTVGETLRKKTKGQYFINKARGFIDFLEEGRDPSKEIIYFITDVRFATEKKDELQFIKDELGGQLVFIERTNEFGELVPPANQLELDNNAILYQNADDKLRWETVGKDNLDSLSGVVKKSLKSLNIL